MRRASGVTITTFVVVLALVGFSTAVALTRGARDITVDVAQLPSPSPEPSQDCASRYVAGGDAVVHGIDAGGSGTDAIDKAYPEQLLEEHALPAPAPGPWCLYNTSKDPTTTLGYADDGSPTQQAEAWDLDPRLITLTVGRQDSVIVEHVTTCFDQIRDHEFAIANACALVVLSAQPAYDALRDELQQILSTYRSQMAGNPDLVVAVTGYYNPYPAGTDVITKIPGFCSDLQDVIPTCLSRWILLPPALETLDLVVKKLNDTIEPVVEQFRRTSQGRFFFVNPYEKFEDHCMSMKVRIDITVYHPTNTVHPHSTDKDFGCDDPWIASDGQVGTRTPFPYLAPAMNGVLLTALQTTREMGIYPDEDGHDCIADLIWEAVKIELDVPEPPEEACT